MPSHWFILIGFGFSQQQSELIFLSWNNSAPFVPVFYCLIPFILFYCQSFVSLGLQVISNPVGCYNKAFIAGCPGSHVPPGRPPAPAVWHCLNPIAARAEPGLQHRPGPLGWECRAVPGGPWWHRAVLDPAVGSVLFSGVLRAGLQPVLGVPSFEWNRVFPAHVSSLLGTVLLQVRLAVLSYSDQCRYDCSGRKDVFSCEVEKTVSLYFKKKVVFLKVKSEIFLWTALHTVILNCWQSSAGAGGSSCCACFHHLKAGAFALFCLPQQSWNDFWDGRCSIWFLFWSST